MKDEGFVPIGPGLRFYFSLFVPQGDSWPTKNVPNVEKIIRLKP